MTTNRMWGWFFLAWMGLACILVLLVPVDVVEIRLIRDFVLIMGDLVPAIGNLAKIPGFSFYAAFVHSLEWLFMPLFMAYGVVFNIVDRAAGTPDNETNSVCFDCFWFLPIACI